MSAWHITSKDLLLLFQDRRALVLLLILPLMFISIVGMSTGQLLTRDESTERFKIAVVDLDATETSHDLVADLSRKPELLITTVASESLGKELMARGDASLVLVIGDQFEERVEELSLSDIFNPKEALAVSGLSAIDLNVHMKPNSAGLGRLLEGVLRAQVIGFVAPITARKNPVTRARVTPREETEDEAGMVGLVESESPKSSSKVNGVYLWVVPGFTVMFAFFVISIMARSFIIERDQGTLRRLMMAPINTVSVLLGKTVPFFLTSVLQCSLLFLCGRILFGMPWGNQPFYLIPVILSTSAAATALGLLLSTLVHTDQQVSSYGTTLILMFSSISGCFFPRELFPKAMRQISLVTPHAWSLKAFDAVLTQPVVDPQAVLMCCGMLLVFAAVFFTTGWWRFRLSAQG